MTSYDAIVIGAGINGMVAAAELAGAGWQVALVDDHDQIGGFIASDAVTEPGFIHDTYSSWHPLFCLSPAYAALGADLTRHGLHYRNTETAVTASVSGDRVVVAHRDPAQTAAGFAEPSDRRAYLAVLDRMGGDMDAIGALLGTELRSARVLRPIATLMRRGGRAHIESWARDAAMSGRNWSAKNFVGWEADQLLAPWLLHAGLSPDSASGGLMMPLFAATIHGAGLPVVAGGAGVFVRAFARLLAERGVDVLLGERVTQIVVQRGHAEGVRRGAEFLRARRAVLASVSPKALYLELLPPAAPSAAQRQEAAKYRPGRAAMQIHVALSQPLRWSAPELAGIPLVHISNGSGSTGIACAEAAARLLPRRPTVAVGQQYLLDASRVPDGAGQLWLQLQEVPYAPTGDSAGLLDTTGGWTPELVSGYVDRVLDLLEEHAPGTKASARSISALSPVDLARHNPNAFGGDPYGGSAELDQNLLWRPGPASARHRTIVPGLWHIGAATHPGPGLGGGSGHLVAQALIGRRAGR